MSEAGPRAKSRTHGTSPTYERLRRNRASVVARAEKRERTRGKGGAGQASLLDLWVCARAAMGSQHLPLVYLKREDHR